MTSKCANPKCSSVFRYLRDGKLFRVPSGVSAKTLQNSSSPKPSARDEFFWLCGECSKALTIIVDPVIGARTAQRGLILV
jgi:hypothetical protein